MAKKPQTDYRPYFRLVQDTFGIYWQFEYQFLKGHRHRFDAALPCCKLAVEVEGGTWIGGGHSRGSGFAADMFKYNNAAILGWRLLRFTPKEVKDIINFKESKTTVFYDTLEAYFNAHPCTHNSRLFAAQSLLEGVNAI